jgi:hypothetical protein
LSQLIKESHTTKTLFIKDKLHEGITSHQ